MDIVLLGAPGAGKGTQAALLVQWLPWPWISTGVLFRSAMMAGTSLGLRAKAYIDQGELVPDDLTIGMVAERLEQADCAGGAIFDGFPRTMAQAEALDAYLAGVNRRVDIAVYVQVSERILLERLAGRWMCRDCGTVYHEALGREKVEGICDVCGGQLYQRDDDAPETQRHRIEVYFAQTAQLIDYYREKGILVEINGEPDLLTVQRDLRQVVADRLPDGCIADTLSATAEIGDNVAAANLPKSLSQ